MKTGLHKRMNTSTPATHWLVLLLSLAGPSMAQAQFIDSIDASRTGWYRYAKNTSSSLSVTSLVNSGRLELKSANTSTATDNNFAAVRSFTAVDMTVVGNKVTLQLDFLTLEDQRTSRGIILGLYDSQGTTITADTSSGTDGDDDSGWFTYISRNAFLHRLYENNNRGILDPGGALRVNEDDPDLRVGGVAGTGEHVAGINSGIWYTYRLEVEAIEGGEGPGGEVDHLVTATILRGIDVLNVMTYTDTLNGALIESLDQVAVISAGGNDFAIDNVSVNAETKYYHLGVHESRLDTAANYSNADGSTTPATVAPYHAGDLILYNSTVTGSQGLTNITGATSREYRSLTFRNPGPTQINRSSYPDTANNTLLYIGVGGITVDAGAGAVTIAMPLEAGVNQRITVGAAASFSIRNNSSSDLTINRGLDGRTVGITNLITIDGSGSGGTIFNAEGIKDQSSGRGIALVIDTEGFARIAGTANNYSGGTTLKKGSLQINANAGSGNPLGTGGLTINGGALAAYGSTRTVVNNVTVGGNFTLGGVGQTITLTGTMDLGGVNRTITLGDSAAINGLVYNGGLTINGGSSTLTLGWANVFTGGTLMNSGTLKLNNVSAVQHSTVTLAGSAAIPLVFDQSVTADAFTLGGLSAASAGAGKDIALQNNEGTPKAVALTVGNNNESTTYAGALSGPGSLIKTGSGTLTLSGASTYSGSTDINAGGTLLMNGSHSGGASYTVTVAGALSGTGTIASAVTVDGVIAPGNGGIGKLTVGNVKWAAGPAWSFELGAASTSDRLAINGGFTNNGGPGFTFDFQNTGVAGVYTLVTWTASTSFTNTDFSANNLPGGLTPAFIMNANSLMLSLSGGSGGITAEATNSTTAVVGGQFTFGFNIASGALYHVQASTNLLLATDNGFTNITGQLTNNGAATITYTNTTSDPVRMFRISSP